MGKAIAAEERQMAAGDEVEEDALAAGGAGHPEGFQRSPQAGGGHRAEVAAVERARMRGIHPHLAERQPAAAECGVGERPPGTVSGQRSGEWRQAAVDAQAGGGDLDQVAGDGEQHLAERPGAPGAMAGRQVAPASSERRGGRRRADEDEPEAAGRGAGEPVETARERAAVVEPQASGRAGDGDRRRHGREREHRCRPAPPQVTGDLRCDPPSEPALAAGGAGRGTRRRHAGDLRCSRTRLIHPSKVTPSRVRRRGSRGG
jgi:hypothetical protein